MVTYTPYMMLMQMHVTEFFDYRGLVAETLEKRVKQADTARRNSKARR